MAKRDINVNIEAGFSTVRENVAQSRRKMNRKRTVADNSKAGREIEALVLEKSAMKSIGLSKLMRDLSDELSYKPDKIIAEIVRLQTEKRILIMESAPYRRFSDYLLSPISVWFWEAALATIASLGLIFASTGWALYIRFIFGGLIVLFLPGYSLLEFLYSKRDDIDYLTRIALSFVLSLAISTLVGLALNFTPFGITLFAVALSLGAVTIGLLLLTAFRRYTRYRLARVMITVERSLR